MPSFVRCTLLLFPLAFVAAGCSPQADYIRGAAEPELHCPSSQIEVVGGSHSYVARGCGKWVEYVCTNRSYDTTCFPRPQAVVNEDPSPRD